jgi:hypothetical protein
MSGRNPSKLTINTLLRFVFMVPLLAGLYVQAPAV